MSGDDSGAALADHAVALRTTDPDAALGDLAPLAERFADADAVGLGEATHGTREFFELRHRLTRLLVEELGFRAVALEASAPAAKPVHDYVLYGAGDAASALEALDSWFWRTEGALALLRRLRAFNEGRPVDDRVRCYGVDVGDPTAPAAPIREFLRDTDPDYHETVRDDLDELAAAELPLGGEVERLDLAEMAESLAIRVAERIDRRREAYVEARSAREVAFVGYLCRTVVRTCEWLRAGGADPGFGADAIERRDRAMAENVESCLERSSGGVAVWAHAGHVKRGRFDAGGDWDTAETMGEALDRALGDRYRPIGFDFGGGAFRAVDAERGEPRSFSVGDPLAESATASMADLDPSPLFLDVAAAADDRRLAPWFERPRRLRSVGAAVDPTADPGDRYAETDLARAYDGLVFVGETEASRPLD